MIKLFDSRAAKDDERDKDQSGQHRPSILGFSSAPSLPASCFRHPLVGFLKSYEITWSCTKLHCRGVTALIRPLLLLRLTPNDRGKV